jgi:hypothetical protein
MDPGYYGYTYPFTVSDSWQTYAVPIDSLRILPALGAPGGVTWADLADSVAMIEFEFSANADVPGDSLRLVLDDFWLEGVGIDNIGR